MKRLRLLGLLALACPMVPAWCSAQTPAAKGVCHLLSGRELAAKNPPESGISAQLLTVAIDFAVVSESKDPRDLKLNHYQTFGREPFGDARHGALWLSHPAPRQVEGPATDFRSMGSLGADAHGRKLRELLRDARVWVKLSGPERASRQEPPYADAVPFASALVEDAGDRVLWGTDWPHPNLTHVPDDGVLADLIASIAPSEAARQALLVTNPRRLYRFGAQP